MKRPVNEVIAGISCVIKLNARMRRWDIVIGNFYVFNLSRAKKLHSWLGRVIGWLEGK